MTKMVVCPRCKGRGMIGKIVPNILTGKGAIFADYECDVCDGKGVVEPMTEQEYIQSCNTEQLAEWICSVHEKCYYCGAKRVSDREHCPFGDGKCRNNKHEIAMWLKQPHRRGVDIMIWQYICRVDCFDVNGIKTWANKYRCPVCGLVITCIENHGLYNYCPQCGKKMVVEWLKQPHREE